MPIDDKVTLQIAGRRIENFLSYEVEADLYQAADRFTLELANPETPVAAGMHCELYVNDQLELTGIIDVTNKTYSKEGHTLLVEGRDLVGLLVDSYVESFCTIQGKTVKQVAELLLKDVPLINRKKILYQRDGRATVNNQPVDSPIEISQTLPGMTVFEVLAAHAESRGLMFFSLPDGTLVFGRPKAKGRAAYNLICRRSGHGSNVLYSQEVTDVSRRYSKITVLSQVQGLEGHGSGTNKNNAKIGVKTDESFPFYKPFVTVSNSDSQAPPLQARMLMERQRQESHQMYYTVPGHSQNGRNFSINELVEVKNELFGTEGVFLIFGRTFRRSKGGTTTLLKLGAPGYSQ